MKKIYLLKIKGTDYMALQECKRGKNDKALIQWLDNLGEDGALIQHRIDSFRYFMNEVKKHRSNIQYRGILTDYGYYASLQIFIKCKESTMKKIIKKANSKLPIVITGTGTHELKFVVREHRLVDECICLEPSQNKHTI